MSVYGNVDKHGSFIPFLSTSYKTNTNLQAKNPHHVLTNNASPPFIKVKLTKRFQPVKTIYCNILTQIESVTILGDLKAKPLFNRHVINVKRKLFLKPLIVFFDFM